MLGSTYRPINIKDFEATKLNYDSKGVAQTITHGSTQNVDLTLTDDMLITGAWLVINSGTLGDAISFQIIDLAGTYAPAGTVLNQFITNWYVNNSVDVQFDIQYPAKIYGGLTLRVIYTSTGSTDPFIAINYKLHKVLV